MNSRRTAAVIRGQRKNRKPTELEVLKEEKAALENQLAMLREGQKDFDRMNGEINKIGVFVRENYGYEVREGLHDNFGDWTDCVIHYLRKERKRAEKKRSKK